MQNHGVMMSEEPKTGGITREYSGFIGTFVQSVKVYRVSINNYFIILLLNRHNNLWMYVCNIITTPFLAVSSFSIGPIKDDAKDVKFNETCCVHNGVPEECMGLCRERHRRSALNDLPQNRCDDHLHKINLCVYEGILMLSCNDFWCLYIL